MEFGRLWPEIVVRCRLRRDAVAETRKLAAILVADIVGYSRLAGADEDRILARLRTLRSDLIDPTIAVHHGRIVKRTGDGSIVEFRSVVDAVRCGIEVQTGLIERNAGVPPERRIEFRVGIHLGDVVEEADGDLMGDGVNIAARLQAICDPGGMCLSSAAHEQVRDKLHEPFVDLGERSLKNIARPIRIYALKPGAWGAAGAHPAVPPKPRAKIVRWPALVAVVLVAGWFGWQKFARAPAPAPPPVATVVDEKLAHAPRLSIVVLSFDNLSGDSDQEYFADDITDDLTTDLSHLPDRFVSARGRNRRACLGRPLQWRAQQAR
jgi:adenylate cyclase